MKSKIVIEVLKMRCEKCRAKAMEIAATANGVQSIALQGDDKTQLVVTGEGVDSVKLTNTLRKKIGRATILEQGEVKEEEKKPEKKPETDATVDESKIHWWHARPAPVLIYDWPHSTNPCSIL